jgi:ADP-dependent NAD(P)H-hydrate dehydratase / NAD(P)H-hydrate epimerase
MKLLRARDVAALDAAAEAAGVGAALLMERAGRSVAATALRLQPQVRRVVVLAGPGNNGGDGYVAATELCRRGLEVAVLEMTDAPRTELARAARAALQATTPAVRCVSALDPHDPVAIALLDAADLVVDALLGAGRARPVDDDLAALFERVRATGAPVLAVDVPSGLDADHADIDGDALTATWTLQLSAVKPASLLPPASERYGAWWIDDLGLDPALIAAHASADVVGRTRAGRNLPRRRSDAHKYRAGAVLVVGGSPRYAGAAELAARAALRGGAGYVTLATPSRLPASWPEFVALPWDGVAPAVWADAPADVTVLGPGLEVDDATLTALLAAFEGRALVLDGGALRPAAVAAAAARSPGQAPWVWTPHAGEAGRLLGRSSAEVARDPLAAAVELAASTGGWVVLKGPATVVAGPDGACRLVPGGPRAMAVAGTGDVLAGTIAAVWAAQRAGHADRPSARVASDDGDHDPIDLLAAAVLLHAEAGRLAHARLAPDAPPSGGLIAGDVVSALPAARAALEALGGHD